ncbi:MAG: hypothetical protein V1815_02200 [Candidatus Woesearchaeota archaeon]
MESLKEYLASKGKIKVLYENHKKASIELTIEKHSFLIIKYESTKGKTVYGLGKFIPAGKLGRLIKHFSLESQVFDSEEQLKKEIEKIVKPSEDKFNLKNYINNSMEHII